ncbi:MAG: hypothetical protein QME40_07000 [bacterium]|nr:hypothetical protein [bacterium]
MIKELAMALKDENKELRERIGIAISLIKYRFDSGVIKSDGDICLLMKIRL